MKLRCATRGSELALAQTREAIAHLASNGVEVEPLIVKSRGDLFSERAIHSFEKPGVFTGEVNLSVLRDQADIGVHSLKDLPSSLPDGLTIAAIPPRASPNDVFIPRESVRLEDFQGVVGTSSMRRRAQLLRIRPDLKVANIRGNVTTRLKKLREGEVDGLIIAKAAVERLKIDVKGETLSLDQFTPAPGQGAIAVVALKGSEMRDLLGKMDDEKSREEIAWEGGISSYIGGGCTLPMGINALSRDDGIELRATILTEDGSRKVEIRENLSGYSVDRCEAVAQKLLDLGGKEIRDGMKRLKNETP